MTTGPGRISALAEKSQKGHTPPTSGHRSSLRQLTEPIDLDLDLGNRGIIDPIAETRHAATRESRAPMMRRPQSAKTGNCL